MYFCYAWWLLALLALCSVTVAAATMRLTGVGGETIRVFSSLVPTTYSRNHVFLLSTGGAVDRVALLILVLLIETELGEGNSLECSQQLQ